MQRRENRYSNIKYQFSFQNQSTVKYWLPQRSVILNCMLYYLKCGLFSTCCGNPVPSVIFQGCYVSTLLGWLQVFGAWVPQAFLVTCFHNFCFYIQLKQKKIVDIQSLLTYKIAGFYGSTKQSFASDYQAQEYNFCINSKYLLYFSEHLICINSFYPHNNPVRVVVISFIDEEEGLKRLISLSKREAGSGFQPKQSYSRANTLTDNVRFPSTPALAPSLPSGSFVN